VGDFIAAKPSTALGDVIPSYRPGVTPTDLSSCLPDFAIEAIREALPAFGRQIKGFDRPDAVLTGVETPQPPRPSAFSVGSIFRVPTRKGFSSRRRPRALPAGILSAAVDGIRVAEAVARSIATAA